MGHPNKENFIIKLTLSVVSVSLSIPFITHVSADNIANPIVSPTDPTQIIRPVEDSSSFPLPSLSNSNEQPKQVNDEKPRSTLLTKPPILDNLGKPYNFTSKKQKNKHVVQESLPAVVPNYQFDIDIGPGDDTIPESTTGLIMSVITGSMLFGS